jgi:hemolysin activation/secretion protein
MSPQLSREVPRLRIPCIQSTPLLTMKRLLTLTTLLAFAITAPIHAAKDDKEDKKSKREMKKEQEEKEKEMKKKEKVEYLYTATISSKLGDATEKDVAEVKSQLNITTAFKCKEVKLDGKQIVATLAVESGRISKSDVNRALKEVSNVKVDKVDEVKPEKEKKEKDAKDADKKDK